MNSRTLTPNSRVESSGRTSQPRVPPMEVFFVLFLLWIFVTLIGHGSFVLIRALFRAVASDQRSIKPAPTRQSDIAATRRVLLELSERDLLTPDQTETIHRSLAEIARPADPEPILASSKTRQVNATDLNSTGNTAPMTQSFARSFEPAAAVKSTHVTRTKVSRLSGTDCCSRIRTECYRFRGRADLGGIDLGR